MKFTSFRAALVAGVVALAVSGCGSTATPATTPSSSSAPSASAPSASAPDSSSPPSSMGSSTEGSQTVSSSAVSPAASPSEQSSGTGESVSGTVTVFAAQSLKKSFDQLTTIFEAKYPGTKVEVDYAGTPDLITQIEGGAEGDVFASADQKNMTTFVDKGLSGSTPTPFVSNTLQIAVSPGNPLKITGLQDLGKSEIKVALCQTGVPCRNAANKALELAGVKVTPATEESSVAAVLSKVSLGEANAGIVYKTDVLSAGGQVDGVDFPEAAKAVNIYPITTLKAPKNPDGAKAFIDLVLSPEGQAVFAKLGFGKP